MLGNTNEITYLLPIKGDSAGGILAGIIGRALPNRHQLLVERHRILCRFISGVWLMNCDKCGQVMKDGTHYWGKYCQTKGCFNSENTRLFYGARYKREGAGK